MRVDCTACRRIPGERWHGDECGPVPSDPVLGADCTLAVARRADRLGSVGGGEAASQGVTAGFGIACLNGSPHLPLSFEVDLAQTVRELPAVANLPGYSASS